jgi:chromosomal replication initiation ATPase DnaA
MTTTEKVLAQTATLLDLLPTDLSSAKRSAAIADGRRVVRLVMMDLGYGAQEIGDALGTGVASVYKLGQTTHGRHMMLAKKVSKAVKR